jgi:hypothetical protein
MVTRGLAVRRMARLSLADRPSQGQVEVLVEVLVEAS